MESKALLVLISLLISGAAFILVFFLTFWIATTISPPVFVDNNGEEHRVMAMGQAFLGVFCGIMASIFSLVICYRKFKSRK